jgi:DNA-binding GntR family transcriptional regulator
MSANLRIQNDLVRTGLTVDQIVRAIADGIVTGAFRPGDKLDEVSLAERFAVSRTPIREALWQLVPMGLVDRRPNRGATVAVVSQERLAAMFETMADLEGTCGRYAALRMNPWERAALEREHLASARLVHLGLEDDYESFNAEFHTRLYRGAHNEHLFELVTLTRSRLAPFRRAQFRLKGRLAKSWEEHDVIVTAILCADAIAAGDAAHAHVATVSEASAVFATGK